MLMLLPTVWLMPCLLPCFCASSGGSRPQAHSNFLASGAFFVVFVGGFSFVNLAFFQHYLLGMVWSISCILWGHLFAWCLHTVKLAVAEEKFTTMERLEIVKLSNILLEWRWVMATMTAILSLFVNLSQNAHLKAVLLGRTFVSDSSLMAPSWLKSTSGQIMFPSLSLDA